MFDAPIQPLAPWPNFGLTPAICGEKVGILAILPEGQKSHDFSGNSGGYGTSSGRSWGLRKFFLTPHDSSGFCGKSGGCGSGSTGSSLRSRKVRNDFLTLHDFRGKSGGCGKFAPRSKPARFSTERRGCRQICRKVETRTILSGNPGMVELVPPSKKGGCGSGSTGVGRQRTAQAIN